MWTSDTGAPYMVLTAHWINNEWDLKHVIIAFQRFPHPHTGEQIQETTLKILQEFSIVTKASTITIDNGANQVAEMKILSTRLAKELQVKFNVIRCEAHTIALVVNAGLKKLQPIIDKVRAFVIEIRRSPKKEEELLALAEKLQVKYKKLIRDVKTQWNSTYSMLDSFLTNKLIINSVLSLHNDFVKLDLTENEWKEVDYFCTFLKPFFDFTEVMSGSNYPTLGTLLLLLDHLSDHIITTIQKTKIPWVKEIAQEMNTKFKSVLEHLYNSSAYLALILDPRYKSQILPDSIDEDTIKQILVEEFNNYQILERSYNSENDDDGSVIGDKRKSIGLLDYMLQKKKKSSNLQSRNEVDEYLITPVEPSNINPCEWWRNHESHYPFLSKIARDYIGIPSTSVPSEQAFSKSGELINKKRNRLEDNSIEACMCLNSWIKLFS